MKAHDFIQPRSRFITSRGLCFGGILSIFKVLKCVGIYMLNDLLKHIHVVQLLFFVKLLSTIVLLPIQKPFSSGKRLAKHEWNSIFQYSILSAFGQILWFYGITLCGPVRSVLIYEHSSLVVISALSAVFSNSGSPAKVRGAIIMGLGFISLIILDKDVTIPHVHSEKHSHHTGLNHLFYHFVNWFGIADHKGGIVILILALLTKVFSENIGRKLSNDLGGSKRLYALSALISTVLLSPWVLFTLIRSQITFESWISFLFMAFLVTFLVFIADFYAEASCSSRLDPMAFARFFPILMFISAFFISYVWFEPYRTSSPIDLIHGHGMGAVEHGFSGGLIFTVVFFILAVIALSTPDRVKARAGQFVGYSASGLPLYVYGEDFLQKTSHSITTFVKNTLRQVLANTDSRRIFYFLCVNLVFTFVEFIYGIFTNSLGLISDAFHMFFDCSALLIGLIAAVMSSWPRTRQFSYGYGRIEILSGFVNGLFLIVIACFIFSEAFKRMLEPPEIRTEKLLFVSVAGLLVNLFGIAVFHGGHGHEHGGGTTSNHGHSHDGPGHSHESNGGHGHSHGSSHSHSHLPTVNPAASHGHSHHGHSHNANMQGVFLHILADTFGSVGVIISTILIQYFGWHIADPICSLLLSVLIFLSVLPLLKQSTSALLLRPSQQAERDFKTALDQILKLNGVLTYSAPHLWQVKSDSHVSSLHIQISNDCDQQKLTQQISNILKCAGVWQSVVQIEKDFFRRTVFALCPSYEAPQIYGHQDINQAYSRRQPFQESLLVKSI